MGCFRIIAILITTLIASLLSYFAPDTPVSQDNYPFVLVENVQYSFRNTLNCQYVIAGNIDFLDNSHADYDNIVIMIQQLGTYDDRPPATVGLGWDTRFGENGWSQLLVGNYWSLVWVHDLSTDTPLSEKILVDGLDCRNDQILATVNFRQIQP